MLALDFASTIRAGRGGLIDELSGVAELTSWARARAAELGVDEGFTATRAQWARIVELRLAVRALFARTAEPGPPSSADAGRLPGFEQALQLVNAAALAVPAAPRLDWPAGAPPHAETVRVGAEDARLAAALAAATIGFLAAAPDLRACPAPRCVLYFVKEHPRQEWCSVSCGNRARAARHYQQHKVLTDKSGKLR